MRYWVVRAEPRSNDPFEAWIKPGRADRWWTKRPPRAWDVGDRLFVWASWPQQEIIGLAELLKPQKAVPDRDGYFWYRLKYLTPVVASPVPRFELERNPALRKSILLRHGPSTSVVRLTDAEGEELYRVVRSYNPSVHRVWRDILGNVANGAVGHFQDLDLSGREGSRVLRQHLITERNPKLVTAKKRAVLSATGKLECQVCGFDFQARYGILGRGFCEVHHLLPLGYRTRARKTKLDELMVLCSNCHRIIHRSRKPLPIDRLQAALR